MFKAVAFYSMSVLGFSYSPNSIEADIKWSLEASPIIGGLLYLFLKWGSYKLFSYNWLFFGVIYLNYSYDEIAGP